MSWCKKTKKSTERLFTNTTSRRCLELSYKTPRFLWKAEASSTNTAFLSLRTRNVHDIGPEFFKPFEWVRAVLSSNCSWNTLLKGWGDISLQWTIALQVRQVVKHQLEREISLVFVYTKQNHTQSQSSVLHSSGEHQPYTSGKGAALRSQKLASWSWLTFGPRGTLKQQTKLMNLSTFQRSGFICPSLILPSVGGEAEGLADVTRGAGIKPGTRSCGVTRPAGALPAAPTSPQPTGKERESPGTHAHDAPERCSPRTSTLGIQALGRNRL